MHGIGHRNSITELSSLQNPVLHQSGWKKRCCYSGGSDGFTVISACFFVLTVAITCSLIIQIHFGSSEVTPHGAVASDNQICSEIGSNKIKEGGTSVDATVASLLCLSVTHPHLVGPGGGGVMLIHDHKSNTSKIFDFLVSYPEGSRRVGVPGFLKGLEKVHNLYGKLPWKTLFQPAISLARDGFNVSEALAKVLSQGDTSAFSHNLRSEFLPRGLSLATGQILFRKLYAEFLKDVSVGGADELHSLKYGMQIMKAFELLGSNVSVHDFHHYKVKERKVINDFVNNVTVATAGPPFGGLQVIAGLELMKELEVLPQTHLNSLYHAFTQGLQLGAGLGNMRFASESDLANQTEAMLERLAARDFSFSGLPPRGTRLQNTPSSQLSAVDTFDLYVAAIVGLGDSFGSGVMTEHGIILNGVSDTAPEPEEAFEGRRPTAFTPLIAMDSNNVCGERVILSSGSWSAMLQTATQLVFRSLDMTSAIVEPRIALGEQQNVLLLNDFNSHVKIIPSSVRQYLLGKNFTLKGLFAPLAVNGVSKVRDSLLSHSDTRGGGVAARLEQLRPEEDL